MSLEMRPGPSRLHGMHKRLSRHAWVVILLLVIALILALFGRAAIGTG